jgi:D-aminoacyl-tRNA deacylase
MKVTVVCSSEDLASRNIKQRLLEMTNWKKREGTYTSYSYLNFNMIEVTDRLIFQDRIDRNLKTDLIIFASRHKSVTSPRPLITAHFSGNVAEAKFGGSPHQLARAAPGALKSLMYNLKEFSNVEIALEATHHGPSNIMKPSVFIELGSSEAEWRNKAMATAIAKAILTLDFDLSFSKCPTAIGFGGTHYAIRHTELLFSSDICFGHIFSLYHLKYLNKELIRSAFEKSEGDFAYFDRKCMGKFKEKIESLIKELGYEVLRSRDIKEHGGLPWNVYLTLRQEVKKYELADTGKNLRVGALLRDNISNIVREFQLNPVEMELAVVHEAQKVDKDGVRKLFDSNAMVYLERSDGFITEVLAKPDIDVKNLINRLQDGCIEILKEHYDIEYSNDQSNIYIIENKFNPQLAAKLGVTPGPLYAELAGGKSVNIDGKLIMSSDVHLKVKRALKIN